MLKNILRVILFISLSLTIYFTVDIIGTINYVPSEFYVSLGTFILTLIAFNNENSDENKIIKIKYKDFTYEFNKLLEHDTKEFNKYVESNNIDEIEKLVQKLINYQWIFDIIVCSHVQQFSISEQLNGTAAGEQADINKLLIQDRNKYIKIEGEMISYINDAKLKKEKL